MSVGFPTGPKVCGKITPPPATYEAGVIFGLPYNVGLKRSYIKRTVASEIYVKTKRRLFIAYDVVS